MQFFFFAIIAVAFAAEVADTVETVNAAETVEAAEITENSERSPRSLVYARYGVAPTILRTGLPVYNYGTVASLAVPTTRLVYNTAPVLPIASTRYYVL